jgi:hypothetical protein
MPLSLPALSPALRSRLLPAVAGAAVCLGAFLSFSVQPLAGKLLLPSQGGTASTWVGAMLYFQAALLLGYTLAVALLRRAPSVQIGVTLGLGLLALAATRLDWLRESTEPGLGSVLSGLGLASLPAMLLLFSLTPLLHGWLRRLGRPVPYYLFAVSNAGGLAAVLLYPFTIERSLSLSDQVLVWRGLLSILLGLLAVAAWLFLQGARETAGSPDEASDETIPASRFAWWAALSALACAGMLGATHHLAAEIGSGPLVWAGPFGLFLLSYIVTFAGGWRPSFTLACFGWLAVSLTGFLLTKGVSPATVEGWRALWLLSLCAAGGFCCNGLLHDDMPRTRFIPFYFAIAGGGVLGGLFASLAAPLLFLRPTEFLGISAAILCLGVLRLLARRTPLTVGLTLVVILAPVLGQVWQQTRQEADGFTRLRRFRSLYGAIVLKFQENGLVLSSETTTHGTQLTQSPEARRQPTLYYTESTGVGRVIEALKARELSLRVGVIGLGAGTLAAYSRETDAVDFWDINPQAIGIARDFFTFLDDSRGRVNIHLADGRRGLADATDDYDLIVIDAFSGDAIPPHLLTYEALATYFNRLRKRRGLLVVHITSRYHDFFPILAATAEAAGGAAFHIVTQITSTTEDRDWDATGTQYVVICQPGQKAEVASWFPLDEDDGRVSRVVVPYDPLPRGVTRIWTDERHADLDTFKLHRFLTGKD